METVIVNVLIGIGVYIAVLSIVDRICKCIEHGHVAKSFDEFTKNNNERQKG